MDTASIKTKSTIRYKVRGYGGVFWGSMCAIWMSLLEIHFRKILHLIQNKKVHIIIHTFHGFFFQERNDYDVFDDEIEGLKDSIKESGQHSVSQINVTPHSLLTDSAEGSTVLPVFVTSESYPELRRVPKDAQFDAHPPIQENEIESR